MLCYLDGFRSERGSSGATLEAPGLVELYQTFVVLQSHSGRDTRTAGASVHLQDQEGSRLLFTGLLNQRFSRSGSPPTWASANTQTLAVASGENWSWPSVRMVP